MNRTIGLGLASIAGFHRTLTVEKKKTNVLIFDCEIHQIIVSAILTVYPF
jgi:hypothetical protein